MNLNRGRISCARVGPI